MNETRCLGDNGFRSFAICDSLFALVLDARAEGVGAVVTDFGKGVGVFGDAIRLDGCAIAIPCYFGSGAGAFIF